jgi:hypothetical protein
MPRKMNPIVTVQKSYRGVVSGTIVLLPTANSPNHWIVNDVEWEDLPMGLYSPNMGKQRLFNDIGWDYNGIMLSN